MSKKKIGILIGVVVVAVALGGTGFYFRDAITGALPFFQDGSAEDKVYVEKVSKIMNQYSGISNRYNGTVESQDSYEVHVDSSRTIEEIKVEVGEVVEEGQTLVTYDTSDLKMQIAQANLEVESINNDIDNYNKQIETLMKESETVAEEDRFTYTTQIQNIQNQIAQKKFDLESKQLEISKFQKQVDNSSVTSKSGGIVKEINEKGTDSNGNAAPFMTILQTGQYRVKGSIDEQNIWTLSEGQEVVVRSRVDSEKTWTGAIAEIDTENPSQGNNNGYYVSSADGDTQMASKYPFYIELDSADGLILGQHVYIELDQGQEETKEGLWLYGSYIVQAGGVWNGIEPGTEAGADVQAEEGPYVWVANEKNRLEKRYVELGAYDADMDEYEILSGLSADDYITWPMAGLYEGVTCVTDEMEVDYSSPLYNQPVEDESVYGTESMDGMMGIDEYNAMDGEALYMEDGTEFIPEDSTETMLTEEGAETMPAADDTEAEVVE